MKQNEYFVFPRYETIVDENGNEQQIKTFDPKDIDLMNPDNYALISKNLYRVQSMSKVMYGNNAVRDYIFRHHLESTVTNNIKQITYQQYKSLHFINDIIKVRVNHIGQIVYVGEY
jgi:CRISPR-associated endonuclease Csn1